MSKIANICTLVLIHFLFVQFLFAQEQGEFLFFDSKSTLKLEISDKSTQNLAESLLYQSPISEKSHEPFRSILFNGILSDTNITFHLRFLQADQNWSSWHPVYLKIFPNGRFWGRYDLARGKTQQIQFRVLENNTQLPVNIQIFAIEGVPESQIKLPEETIGKVPEKVTFSILDTLPKPPLVTRQQWSANPPIGLSSWIIGYFFLSSNIASFSSIRASARMCSHCSSVASFKSICMYLELPLSTQTEDLLYFKVTLI